MKRIKLFVLLVLCLMVMPVVHASTASTVITGTNSIKVGQTTSIYIKVNGSANIEGVDVTYSTSGNISVTNVSVASGFTQMGQSGNRYILYAMNPVSSGSSVLVLTVKGTAVGTGTVTVNSLEATVSGETASGGSRSYQITVNPLKTAAEIKAEEEARKVAQQKAEEERKRQEEEAKKQEEERKAVLEAAVKLVEKSEESLSEKDYDEALKAVEALVASDDKTSLVNRLNDVKFKIAVNKECSNKGSIKCDECKEMNDDAKPWIVLSIILLIGLILETAYLVYKKVKKED